MHLYQPVSSLLFYWWEVLCWDTRRHPWPSQCGHPASPPTPSCHSLLCGGGNVAIMQTKQNKSIHRVCMQKLMIIIHSMPRNVTRYSNIDHNKAWLLGICQQAYYTVFAHMYTNMYLHILTRLSPPPVTSLFVEEELGTLELPWVSTHMYHGRKRTNRKLKTAESRILTCMFTVSLTRMCFTHTNCKRGK